MSTSDKSMFQFTGFKIIESHIIRDENLELSQDIKIGFNPRGKINRTENTYKILLGVIVKDENDAFKANIEVIGYYKFPDAIEQDLLDKYFYTNAPAILFPYVRAYISTLTNLSGIDIITLPTLNLSALGGRLKENTTEV